MLAHSTIEKLHFKISWFFNVNETYLLLALYYTAWNLTD